MHLLESLHHEGLALGHLEAPQRLQPEEGMRASQLQQQQANNAMPSRKTAALGVCEGLANFELLNTSWKQKA